MASAKFLDVFKNHLTEEQRSLTENAVLINCTVSDERALDIKLYSDKYISFSNSGQFFAISINPQAAIAPAVES